MATDGNQIAEFVNNLAISVITYRHYYPKIQMSELFVEQVLHC